MLYCVVFRCVFFCALVCLVVIFVGGWLACLDFVYYEYMVSISSFGEVGIHCNKWYSLCDVCLVFYR